MPVDAQCPQCHALFRAKDEFAGRTVTCPKCKHALTISHQRSHQRHAGQAAAAGNIKPRAHAEPSPAAAQNLAVAEVVQTARPATTKRPAQQQLSVADRQQRMLAGFIGSIEPVPVPMSYRVGILVVAGAMVLLPIVYLLLIVATAYGVYFHLTQNVGMLEYGSGRGWLFVLLAYLTPLVAGATMVVFMIKPLFACPAKRDGLRSLNPEDEPILFNFVNRLCDTLGAPTPKRIEVDCDVNASARFRRGIFSVIMGNDLVLTIGMPLAAGMSVPQLAGILAHEFGHFSQGAGMRLTYLVRTISMWFTRVVYERDSWDEVARTSCRRTGFPLGMGDLRGARLCLAFASRAMVLDDDRPRGERLPAAADGV